MESLLYGLAVLACPVGMGVMMWMMVRRRAVSGGPSRDADTDRQFAELREELRVLRPRDSLDIGRVPSTRPTPPADA